MTEIASPLIATVYVLINVLTVRDAAGKNVDVTMPVGAYTTKELCEEAAQVGAPRDKPERHLCFPVPILK